MVFSRVFRQLLELQSKIEHWKLPRCIFGVSPGDVAQAGLRGAAKHLSEHPDVTPRNAKKKYRGWNKLHRPGGTGIPGCPQGPVNGTFSCKGGRRKSYALLARWNFRVLRHTGKTLSSSPTTRTFTSTQWTREKASQVLVDCTGLLIVNQICLAKSYLFINLNDQWFQYIPIYSNDVSQKGKSKKIQIRNESMTMATFHLHKWVQFHEVPPKRAPWSIWKKCHLRTFWDPEIKRNQNLCDMLPSWGCISCLELFWDLCSKCVSIL